MFITADQLLAHAIGDYLLQSDWMASQKTKRSLPAFLHAFTYSIPFMCMRPSIPALLFILVTHFMVDRWRLARFVIYAKNAAAPAGWVFDWADCSQTGYHKDRPAWLAVWLLIIGDNTIHVLLNGIALKYL